MDRLLTALLAALIALPLVASTSPPGEGSGRPHGPANVDGLGLDRPGGHPDEAFGEDYVGDDEDRSARIDPDEDQDYDGLDGRAERRLGTDPNEEDSDGDGLLDGEEDPDGDALTSEQEERTGRDPGRWDGERSGAVNAPAPARTI